MPEPYEFRRLGRDVFEYRAGNRRARLYGEMLTGPIAYAFRPQSVLQGWEPPHEAEPFSDDDRQVILRRFDDYMRASRTPYTISS
jgi:hypothetical protein